MTRRAPRRRAASRCRPARARARPTAACRCEFCGIGSVSPRSRASALRQRASSQTSVFGTSLIGREAAGGVAVERRVADGDLALVAGGQQQVPVLVGQPHEQRAAHPGLQVLRGDAGQLDLTVERVDHRRDRHDRVVQPEPASPGPRRRRASARWSTSTAGRRRARGRRPARRRRARRTTAESMPPESPRTTEGMPFLSMKSRRPSTSARQTSSQSVSGSATRARAAARTAGTGWLGQHVPGDRHRPDPAVACARARRPGRASRSTVSRCSTNCGARASSVAVGGDDHRVAVEDQLVLAADLVAVHDRRARLGRAAAHQRQPQRRPWPARTGRRWGRRRGRRRPARRRRTGRPRPRGPRRW